MARVLLREVLDAERRRHAEVHRLAGQLGERLQRGPGELGEALAGVAVREPKQHRPRRDAAVAGALDEATAFERAYEPGRRRLRQPAAGGELADRERSVGLDHADEELRRAVDRLRACLGHAHMVEHAFHVCQVRRGGALGGLPP